MGDLTLITGGARAGRTTLALRLAADSGLSVTYLATAEARDAEMTSRIARHRAERPSHWRTVEAPLAPAAALAAVDVTGTVIVDCLTMLVSNLLLSRLPPDDFSVEQGEQATATALAEVERLLAWRESAGVGMIVVTNEVGWGIVPASPQARLYQDPLGWANQRIAARAARVYLVAAGLALEMRAAGAIPVGVASAVPDGVTP
jgi:adenosylcobinamide kinase/adenosylcobinamide-phosphate guanylyltransferase